MARWLRELATLAEDLISVPSLAVSLPPVTPAPRDYTHSSSLRGYVYTHTHTQTCLHAQHKYINTETKKEHSTENDHTLSHKFQILKDT